MFLVAVALIFRLVGCSEEDPAVKAEREKNLKRIEVRAEVQDMVNEKGENKVVVFVKNNSDKTYSDGHIQVTSLDIDGSHLGFDGMFPNDLEPGKNAYGITWLKVSRQVPKIEEEVLGGQFQ